MTNPFENLAHRRGIFGGDAANYAVARPGYPDGLYEVLAAKTGLGAGTRVLEVGAGTGQATTRLLGLGAEVTAVELDQRMADQLLADGDADPAPNVAGSDRGDSSRATAAPPGVQRGRLDVVVSAFEDVAGHPALVKNAPFDLVAAGTAFHWVPIDVGFDIAADLLVEDGWLALWWTTYMDPETPSRFEDAFQPMLAELAPELLAISGGSAAGIGSDEFTPPYALDSTARIAEIDGSGRFGPVDHHQIRWTGIHDAVGLRSLFSSFSPFMALDPEQARTVMDAIEGLARDEFNNHVERPYVTSAYLAQKRL